MLRLPHWHAELDERAQDSRLITSCPMLTKPDSRLPATGFVPCQPEALLRQAKKRLHGLDIKGDLDLDAYSIGRLIRSEFGTAPVEAKVAAAEIVNNLARRLKTTPSALILTNEHQIGLYGSIRQGRGFDSSLDPTAGDLAVSTFVLSGRSTNFARGADNYAHPNWGPIDPWLQQSVWVGQLPNVPPAVLIALKHVNTLTPEHQRINERAIMATHTELPSDLFGDPEPSPRWETVKALGIATGTGLVLFGLGVALTDLYGGKSWKDWKSREDKSG